MSEWQEPVEPCPGCREGWREIGAQFCPTCLAEKPHKVMTFEEYASLKLKGWHMVCHDVDGFGGVGIRFMT